MVVDLGSLSPDETLPPIQFKPRRAHEKSKSGCARCKQQRKKCDETKPRCSRCAVRNYRCQYVKSPFKVKVTEGQQKQKSASKPDVLYSRPLSLSVSASSNSLAYPISSLSVSRASQVESLFPHPSSSEDEGWLPDLLSSGVFDPVELALLSHYLTHTSRIIPFDEDDFYALRAGIPNLAFNSRPLMASLLALAAACKCYDIIKYFSAPLECLEKIRELLDLADRYHRASLQQIQAAIPNTDRYDHVLANAALMVLYCSAGHSVRVRLVKAARLSGEPLPSDVRPVQSQWISLIRAAHAAYDGLLNCPSDFPNASPAKDSASWTSSPLQLQTFPLCGNEGFSPEDGPSKETKRLFFPIVAATYGPALEKLRTKAQSIAIAERFQACKSEIRACFVSLEILGDVITDVFSTKDSDPERTQQSTSDYEPLPLGHLSEVSPWLRRYLGRVTSAVPSKPLRRTVMAFVNRVPLEYLNSIQSVLDLIPVNTGYGKTLMPWEVIENESSPSNATHLLAMDILAHWLVLVMLLDGVWWIADIGEWELGRVVSFMRTQACLDPLAHTGESWWPESMLKVKKELEDYIAVG